MKKYFAIIFSVVLMMSCADLLTTYPSDEISSDIMWTTEALTEGGMNGLYQNFYFKSSSTGNWADASKVKIGVTQGICRQIWMGLEFQSFNDKDGGLNILKDATKDPSDDAVVYEWQWCYTGIHRINDAIENLPRAPIDTETYENYLCEAKFLRAWYYSRLNQIYQGVPIYLEPITESECTKGQSTSTEVWEVVIDDLNYCINNQYFPDNNLTGSRYGRPSKGSAYSLRAMAYMWLAWENNDDNSYYQLAANDFEKVAECGFGLWYPGSDETWIDLFHYKNEQNSEMIFPIQYEEELGYSDYIQVLLSCYDAFDGWSCIRPDAAFVDYYQNNDGTTFNWADKIPEWNDDVFVNDLTKREVFFLRNGINVDSSGNVILDNWNESEAAQMQERVNVIGLDIFNKYYLPNGNEERLRTCYYYRDPRLRLSIVVPYDPYDTTSWSYAAVANQIQIGKEKRWPHIRSTGDYSDFYVGVTPGEQTYIWKKFCYHLSGELANRSQCQGDWPLIRYTDMYLHLAECYVHLGRLSDAINIVNEIRDRVGMPSVSVGSSDEVMEAVRYERRVELCAEGVDFFDEIRWGTFKEMKFQGMDNYGPTTYWGEWDGYNQRWYYTDDMYPWGVPLEEYQRNPNLTPRAGWAY